MQPFQQRVVDERDDLVKKTRALSAFIQGPVYDTLPKAERTRLAQQFGFMACYEGMLDARIAAFSA